MFASHTRRLPQLRGSVWGLAPTELEDPPILGPAMKPFELIPFEKPYRCLDCGRAVGVRSHPRTFTEQYILPLFLMQPVRCAECFRRDYRSVFTRVHEREEPLSDHRKAA